MVVKLTLKKMSLSVGAKVVDVVSDSFVPFIGVMAGSGMLKALLAILILLDWQTTESSTYVTLYAASNAVFYFLPVLLGSSLAHRLGSNSYLGATVGATLLEPSFIGLIGAEGSHFLGLPFTAIDYSCTVFPVFIAVSVLSVLEKQIRDRCPENIRLFMVPMSCLMVIVPLTVMVFGPIGVYLGHLLAATIDNLQAFSSVLTGAVIGGGMMLCVVVGLHWGIVPVAIASAATASGDSIVPMWAPSTFAQMGIAFAIYFSARRTEDKVIAGPAALTGLLAGVTEPIIYGLIMRYRRTIPIVILAGMVGGAINGYFQVKMTAFVFQNIFTIPVFNSALWYLTGISVSFSMALVLTLLFGYEKRANISLTSSVESKAF